MRSRVFLTFLVLFALSLQAFALGKAETEVKTQNDEWILCVTDFDLSAISADKASVAGVITRKIVERLKIVSYRTRVSPEYAHYEGAAWARARTTAAKALSAKQDERSMQLYRGDQRWRYRQNLARIDTEIEKLRLALEEVENNPPPINKEPEFKLTAGNINSSFPAPPRAGTEQKFCIDQKADAFLAGSIMDFHGRFHVSIRLYTAYTRSFVWEDSIIFSTEDIESALDEITGKLLIVLSGNRPSAVIVRAQPEETLVLINQTFAGRGETALTELPPGKITVTASAPGHKTMTLDTELSPGELSEIDLTLAPVEFADVEIAGYKAGGGNVYHGALYVGEAPLTLRLPLNVLEYVEMEIPGIERGTTVFQTPDNPDTMFSFNVRTEKLLKKGRVDRVRRTYYWAWGGTWATGIAAWLAYHSYMSMDASIRYAASGGGPVNMDFYNDYLGMNTIQTGTLIAVGVVAVYGIFQMGRYIYISNKGSTNIAKTGRNRK